MINFSNVKFQLWTSIILIEGTKGAYKHIFNKNKIWDLKGNKIWPLKLVEHFKRERLFGQNKTNFHIFRLLYKQYSYHPTSSLDYQMLLQGFDQLLREAIHTKKTVKSGNFSDRVGRGGQKIGNS